MAATSEGSGDPDDVAERLDSGTVVAEGLDAGAVAAVACVTAAGGAVGEALDSPLDPQAVTDSITAMMMSGTSVLRRICNKSHLIRTCPTGADQR